MSSFVIQRITAHDSRFTLKPGEGVDAVHSEPEYSYAVALLHADGLTGSGLAFTLGAGNDLVCSAITMLAEPLIGHDINEIMAEFGIIARQIADHPADTDARIVLKSSTFVITLGVQNILINGYFPLDNAVNRR